MRGASHDTRRSDGPASASAEIIGRCETIARSRRAGLAAADRHPMRRAHLNPPELPDWSSLFSQVVVAEGSPLRVIAVSGQVGVDRSQALSGDGSFVAQLDRAFENLAMALAAASCSMAEVIKLTIYVVGYSHEKADVIGQTLRRHFESRTLPACSLIGVQALARPEFQVEVEALAIAEGSGG